MPELPEVERVRQSLAARAVGRGVRAVEVRRPGVVRGDRSTTALLAGHRITAIERLGKQLAILGSPVDTTMGEEPRCLCIHLGMTGSLCVVTNDNSPRKHIHVVWHLDDGSRIEFRDPRRFGGIWVYPNKAELLKHRWRHLGADALRISPAELYAALHQTRRPIKAALLDQEIIAGLGNIYVDELLFGCGIHPLSRSDRLSLEQFRGLVPRMKRLLRRAITAGGSSLRDYVDANGQAGEFQLSHRVYGRRGLPCRTCGKALSHTRVGGRMTVFCVSCQKRY